MICFFSIRPLYQNSQFIAPPRVKVSPLSITLQAKPAYPSQYGKIPVMVSAVVFISALIVEAIIIFYILCYLNEPQSAN
jgi:hypothetical protein